MQNNPPGSSLQQASVVLIVIALALSNVLVGTQLAMASSDPTKQIKEDWIFEGHERHINDVAVSADDEWVYSAGEDGAVRRIDSTSGVEDADWRYEEFSSMYGVRSVVADSDDNVYAGGSAEGGSLGYDYAVHSIDEDGDQRWSTNVDGMVHDLELDATNNHLYVGLSASVGVIRLDMDDGSIDTDWEINTASTVNDLAMDNSGNIYVGKQGSAAGFSVYRFDSDGDEDWEYEFNDGSLRALALSDEHVYFGGSANKLMRLDAGTGERDADYGFDADDWIWSLALDSSGNLYVGTGDGELIMLDSGGEEMMRYSDHDERINAIALDSNDVVYIGSGSGLSSTGEEVRRIDFTNGVSYSVENTPSGVAVIDTDTDEDIRIGEGDTQNHGTTIRLQTEDEIPIASTYMALTSNRDFDAVSAGVDTDTNLSFVHGLSSLDIGAEGDGTFTLFVPRDEGDNRVHICPGASTLSEVEAGCSDEEVFSEESSAVEIINWQGSSYWTVSGLEGTGGFSTASTIDENGTAPSEDAQGDTAPGLPDTGFGPSALGESGHSSAGSLVANYSIAAILSVLVGSLLLFASGYYLLRRYSE